MTAPQLRGTVVWGVVPFVPEAPFRIYQRDAAPLHVKDARPLFEAATKQESEFSFIVRAKARPVLILAEVPDPRVGELMALRLVRLSRLDAQARARVVGQEDELLFHVKPQRAPGLAEESAVMIAAPVRVHRSAIDAKNILGRLDANELRVVHERFVKLYGLDLFNLIRQEIQRLRRLHDQAESSE